MLAVTRITCFCLLLLSIPFPGQTQSPPSDKGKEAADAYDSQDWVKAAELYGQIAKQLSQPPVRVWLRLGTSLREGGKYDDALAAFEKATQAGAPLLGEYGTGTVYAAMQQPEKALDALEKAVQQGYGQPEQLETEPSLAGLKSDPRFAKIVEQAKRNARPCAYRKESRQFDFWAGEWDVTSTQGGLPAGNSKIELILEGCVVLENWKSLGSPYAGKSYNAYNIALKRWEQYWVDNVGGNIFFHGELKDGVMDYWTDDVPQPDGTKLLRHLQFIPLNPDKVRQFSRGSNDSGKTWHVEYDLTYTRKK